MCRGARIWLRHNRRLGNRCRKSRVSVCCRCSSSNSLAAEIYDGTDPINLGTDHEITIRQTVETIKAISGFTGDVVWDSSKPDGQPRRRIDPTRAHDILDGAPRWTSNKVCKILSIGFLLTGTSPKPNRVSAATFLLTRHSAASGMRPTLEACRSPTHTA